VIEAVYRKEGAGFVVRRPFPTRENSLVDPFLLLDEFGPTDYGPYEAKGAPDHPHRGFETVSYILEGDVHHRDSMGHDAVMGPGGVQWMTAGSGIVHSEMPSQERLARGGRIHGFQLWVNLPRSLKMMEPHYQELEPHQVSVIQSDGEDGNAANGRIVAGSALGAAGAIQTTLPTSYQHWSLPPGAFVELPFENDQGVSAYVFGGTALLGRTARRTGEGTFAVFGEGEMVRLGAERDGPGAELLLLAAAPLREPVARRGPFVMSTDAEIRQAYADYRSGKMGRIG
jgi:redox-sensitive bicupin YhaK (pirin superfamily)